MSQEQNLVLIGFMGSGKTSVGVKLSYRLCVPVEDTDKLIERKEGKSVYDIFADDGEAYFRQLETQVLCELVKKSGLRVYSVGGGAPVREENRKWLKKLGRVVYLKVSPETVYERLKGDFTRPLLQGPDPRGRIIELMRERAGIYESCADIIVDADGATPEEIARRIEKQTGRLRKRPDGE